MTYQSRTMREVMAETALGNANKKLQLMASITRHDLKSFLTHRRIFITPRTERKPDLASSDIDKPWEFDRLSIR